MPDPSSPDSSPESSPAPARPAPPRRRGWMILAAIGLAILFMWTSWGRGPGRGSIVPASITLVTADRDDLACASDKVVGDYRCEFRAPGTRWPDQPAPVDRLAPYYTVDQKLYVVAGLFEEPALAKRYADEEQHHLPRDQRPRFVADCQLKLVGRLKDFQTRWLKTGGWGHQADAWVATPSDCRIQ
jgi:hypothetical protein